MLTVPLDMWLEKKRRKKKEGNEKKTKSFANICMDPTLGIYILRYLVVV
jgi:hypothetical protein